MIGMIDNRLENLKEEKFLKSSEIIKELNILKSNYSEWEHGKIPIPTRRIIQFADFYKVNIDYMLKLSNKRIIIDSKTKIDLKEIGKKLKEIRLNLGLSLRKLGDKLNCSFSAFASYERGECLIQSETLINLCKLSNFSIDWIFDRVKDKKIK